MLAKRSSVHFDRKRRELSLPIIRLLELRTRMAIRLQVTVVAAEGHQSQRTFGMTSEEEPTPMAADGGWHSVMACSGFVQVRAYSHEMACSQCSPMLTSLACLLATFPNCPLLRLHGITICRKKSSIRIPLQRSFFSQTLCQQKKPERRNLSYKQHKTWRPIFRVLSVR